MTATATDETMLSELDVGTETVTGGTPDYEIVWSDLDGNPVDPAGLSQGTYTVTVLMKTDV